MKYKKRPSGTKKFSASLSNSFSRLDPYLIGFLLSIFDFIISVYALVTRSFLRKKLGERTFNIFTIILMFSFVYVALILQKAIPPALVQFPVEGVDGFMKHFVTYIIIIPSIPWLLVTGYQKMPEIDTSAYVFLIVIFIVCIGHITDVIIRRRRDEIIHSYHRGDSLLFGWMKGRSFGSYIISDLTIWMIVEPLFVLFVAWLINKYYMLGQVSLILAVSAVCMFIEEYRVDMDHRKFVLDIIDGQLDAQYAKEVQNYYSSKVEELKMHDTQMEYQASIGSNDSEKAFGSFGKKRYSEFKAKIN